MPLGEGAYLIGQLIGLAAVGLLAGRLHRTTDHPGVQGGTSAPVRPPAGGPYDDDFGRLRVAALARDLASAKVVRERLAAAGIRASLATAVDGLPRVLVFADDLDRAKRFVSSPNAASPEGTGRHRASDVTG
ncbi:MAG TPA: hypothetical protein VFR67_14690 [Pilimelia sp.]|nr:hypothetical protein [Pilimelia sp.]